MTCSARVVAIGNTSTVRVQLTDENGDAVNSATATFTILDSLGDEVAGQSWPTALTFVSGSDGEYTGTLSEDVAFEENSDYLIQVDATVAGGAVGKWKNPLIAETPSLGELA